MAAVLSLASGCGREEKIRGEPTDESPLVLDSSVHAADPKASVQLIKGFHGVEHSSWRWTMGKFAIVLRPPAGARERGADLILKFTIPESFAEKIKSTTMSVFVQNTNVGMQDYNAAGEYSLRVGVPATLLQDEAVNVEYVVEPHLPAGLIDARELGVVFVSAGFETK